MSEKILIVDDDVDSLKLIGLMLQRQGYEVIAASAGNQAITKATNEIPDLIILDVMMPDMNGYEVCRRLRANPSTHSIPIIMFTAKTLIDDKVAGFEAGADDYLTKPTHPAELSARIKGILQKNVKAPTLRSDAGLTIGILGAKGGVGTTTIALNLAIIYRQMDYNPIVADFRLGAGTLGLFMGIKNPSGMATVLGTPTEEIRADLLEHQMSVHATGLRALLSSVRPKEDFLNFSPESAVAVVNGLRSLGKPAIFDLGTGYTPLVNRLQREMDRLIIVVDPFTTTISMAHDLLNEIHQNDDARTEIVVVSRNQNNSQLPWHEIETSLEHEIRATISADPDLVYSSAEAGTPFVLQQPGAKITSQIKKLAEDLVADSSK
jgi:pilus assembly protein CpaE